MKSWSCDHKAKIVPGRKNSLRKGPEVGGSLLCLEARQKPGVCLVGGGEEGRVRSERKAEASSEKVLSAMVWSLDFMLREGF